jgi:hypothetical protein
MKEHRSCHFAKHEPVGQSARLLGELPSERYIALRFAKDKE